MTRNIAASPGAAVIDVSAPDVDLDLNGMELLQPDPTLPPSCSRRTSAGAGNSSAGDNFLPAPGM